MNYLPEESVTFMPHPDIVSGKVFIISIQNIIYFFVRLKAEKSLLMWTTCRKRSKTVTPHPPSVRKGVHYQAICSRYIYFFVLNLDTLFEACVNGQLFRTYPRRSVQSVCLNITPTFIESKQWGATEMKIKILIENCESEYRVNYILRRC